jgi:glycine/D-amino acid oxidase-like deaminating enzyme
MSDIATTPLWTEGAGRSTLVLDAAPVGAGCSSRNGGQVAYSIKPSLAELRSRHGAELAWRICAEGHQATANLRGLARGLEQRLSVVSRAQQRAEIATDFYHGGCVYHDDASVDPMRLLIALYRRAEACRV